ncbi:hypothetical protein RIB2604_01800240 [Aspergillus luchuensis]|uniref:Uncharacterized protein n=1 Tax=Aspergillus kawachii TaxID=1069201 RepID=A0A146FF39_ASPKA|nr:hypothetical protein RIB2604_01800240 [Aspergillus luchuensis]
MVRYFFYKGCLPDTQQRLQELVAVAYQTARDRRLYPKAVLIRSVAHATTNIMGRPQKDPLGPHVTLCYKDEDQLNKGEWTPGGDIVWPPEEELDEAPEIGYGHFPEPAETDCTGVNT